VGGSAQILQYSLVVGASLALPHHRAIPTQAMALKAAHNAFRSTGHFTGRVYIFNAQMPLAAMLFGV
jgi:hypothetical protein